LAAPPRERSKPLIAVDQTCAAAHNVSRGVLLQLRDQRGPFAGEAGRGVERAAACNCHHPPEMFRREQPAMMKAGIVFS
jgi:hypothetical protein